MPGFDALAPDQKAVLQLLLKQGKSYGEIAGLLRLEPASVRERALDALDALGADGPAPADALAPERQDEVADHLLLQQDEQQHAATRTFLAGSPEGRAWARAVAAELQPLAGDRLPEIPAEPARRARPGIAKGGSAAVAPAATVGDDPTPAGRRGSSREGRPESSRLGGILVLLALGAVLAVGAVLLLRGGDDDDPRASTPAAATDGATGTTGAAGLPQQQINLTPPEGRSSKALGVAVIAEGALALQAEGLPESNRYVVWLYNSREEALQLGFAPYDRETRRVAGQVALPAEAAGFGSMIITRERTSRPTRPGTIVLRGPIRRG